MLHLGKSVNPRKTLMVNHPLQRTCRSSCRTHNGMSEVNYFWQNVGGIQCSWAKKQPGCTFVKPVVAIVGLKAGACGCEVGTRGNQDRPLHRQGESSPGKKVKLSTIWHENETVTPEGRSWTRGHHCREGDFWLKVRKNIWTFMNDQNVLIGRIISSNFLMRNMRPRTGTDVSKSPSG